MYTEGQTLKLTATETNPMRKVFTAPITVTVVMVVDNILHVQLSAEDAAKNYKGRDQISFPFEPLNPGMPGFYPNWTIEIIDVSDEPTVQTEVHYTFYTIEAGTVTHSAATFDTKQAAEQALLAADPDLMLIDAPMTATSVFATWNPVAGVSRHHKNIWSDGLVNEMHSSCTFAYKGHLRPSTKKQLNIRISQIARTQLDALKRSSGSTEAEVVERALERMFAQEIKPAAAQP